jgi:hypothetical protein
VHGRTTGMLINFYDFIVCSHTQTHKIHHDPDLGEATTFPLSVFSMSGHKGYIQMSFCPGTFRKFLNLRLSPLGRPIISCAHIWLKWGLKESCRPCWELSSNMWHATYTQVNEGDSWLLMVKNQISTFTPDFSFGHNLCFKYSNGSCEHILDIYILRNF